MQDPNVENTDPATQGGGDGGGSGTEAAAPVSIGLNDLSQRFGGTFSSVDDFYAHIDSQVSSGREKIEQADKYAKAFESLPDPVKHYLRLQSENQGVDGDQLLDRYVQDLSTARTDFAKMAETNPEEVLVRAAMLENDSLTRADAERLVRRTKQVIENTYDEEDRQSELILEAKQKVKALEAAKPKFNIQQEKPDPAKIEQHKQAVAHFKQELKNLSANPYTVAVGDQKVEVRSQAAIDKISAALASEDPAYAIMEDMYAMMHNGDVIDPSKVVAMANLVYGAGDIHKTLLARAQSEATRLKEASSANAGGAGAGAPASTTSADKLNWSYLPGRR